MDAIEKFRRLGFIHKRFRRLDITIYNHFKHPVISVRKHEGYFGLFVLFIKIKAIRRQVH